MRSVVQQLKHLPTRLADMIHVFVWQQRLVCWLTKCVKHILLRGVSGVYWERTRWVRWHTSWSLGFAVKMYLHSHLSHVSLSVSLSEFSVFRCSVFTPLVYWAKIHDPFLVALIRSPYPLSHMISLLTWGFIFNSCKILSRHWLCYFCCQL